ncbi:ATP-binding cassette, subfamily B [Mucilaginibacter mallensis]|uniref:Multidrug resistance-like ATP-binding protein MdlB n=1 Tax=Mucilaginibacter mallensis TaxID=652787 RepID=A0A1H1ZUG5_MUCMA|nr:peptidase domain-containing ABC transporter [Mucilaginibacter mallensis]SDT37042.1 ATP-binding cassette, subfamily B [Mucilaginibacter mallensis]
MGFTFFKQQDTMDCGATCLRMVCGHYGRKIGIVELRRACRITSQGASLLGVMEAAEVIGFSTTGLELSLKDLHKLKLPAILHWTKEHFVVLFKIKKDTYYVADPSKAIIKFSKPEFTERWCNADGNGIALELVPLPALQEGSDKNHSSHGGEFLKRYFYIYKALIFQILIGLAIASLLQLVLPFLTQSLIDTGIRYRNINFIQLIIIAQVMLLIGRAAVNFIRSWLLFHLSMRINLSILADFVLKLMKLPISFFLSKTSGDILQRINDQSKIESFLTGPFLNTIFSLGNLIVFSVLLFFFNKVIFLISLIGVIAYSLWVLCFLRYRRFLNFKKFDVSSKNQNLLMQLIFGIKEIKLNNSEREFRWEWENSQVELFRWDMKNISLNQVQEIGATFINESKNILITYLCATYVIHGEITLGTMMAMLYVIGQLNSPVEYIALFVQEVQDATISWERLNEVQQMDDEFSGTEDRCSSLPDNRNIYIENLDFSYPGAGNPTVIDKLSFEIPYGKSTAIVGKSGCGKTTLVNLILQLYSKDAGKILVGNIDIEQMDPRAWRQACGFVMQDGYIFSDTIIKNITVSTGIYDQAMLDLAIEVANLGDFINDLALKGDTKIGVGGVGLSQGQKQRILIARVVYKNADFVFLDEATNALDAENERTIISNFNKFFKGKTVVIIAHRLSTVTNADNIIVMSKGKLIEQGRHESLIKEQGAYYSLIKNQLELGI